MGRVTVTARYEITDEIKELQRLANDASAIGYETNVDITQDLVTINGWQKMTRAQAKAFLTERLLDNNKLTTADFPDQAQVAKEAKAAAKRMKTTREPGAPAEDKQIIKRAKRIYKKYVVRFRDDTLNFQRKSIAYITKKSDSPEQQTRCMAAFKDWVEKQ